ncbi:MAG: OmpA family protein [Deltaproteobacteria bacterium]|nr:OmpA family protein [Deltaproteobacteria bacterium]
MRISTIAAFLFASLIASAGCSSEKHAATVPAAPEFKDPPALEARPASAASDGAMRIAPEDQVFFALDSAVLQPSALPLLDDVAAWVLANPERTLRVQGFADPVGTKDYNLALSMRRADAVVAYLRTRGVPTAQLTTAAVGEHDAVLEPRSANRRVVIYATALEQPAAAR